MSGETLFDPDRPAEIDERPEPCMNPTCHSAGTVSLRVFGHHVGYACRPCSIIVPAIEDDRDGRAAQAVGAMRDEPARLHRGASRAQRESIETLDPETLSEARTRTLRWVAQEEDGITCDALEAKTRVSHQSLSARLNWLERHGLVERDHDDLRRTRSGRSANPYHLTEAGAEALDWIDRHG